MALLDYLRSQAALPTHLRDPLPPEPTDEEREAKRADLARRIQADTDQTMLTMRWANGDGIVAFRNSYAALRERLRVAEAERDAEREACAKIAENEAEMRRKREDTHRRDGGEYEARIQG